MHSTSSLEALILRTIPYGERDAVVHLLTSELGRLAAFARGVRGSKRRFSGGLQRYALLQVELRSSAKGMPTLQSTQVREWWQKIGQDLSLLSAASIVLEISGYVLNEGEADPDLFRRLVSFMRWIGSPDCSPELAELGFYRILIILLDHTGHWPEIGRCVRTGASLEGHERLSWLPDEGPVSLEAATGTSGWPLSAEAWEALCGLVTQRLPKSLSPAAARQLDSLLRGLWERVLERRITSWELGAFGR